MDCKNPAGGAGNRTGKDRRRPALIYAAGPSRPRPNQHQGFEGWIQALRAGGGGQGHPPLYLRQVYGAVAIDDGISGHCLVNVIARMTKSLETFDVQLALRLTKFGDHAAQLS